MNDWPLRHSEIFVPGPRYWQERWQAIFRAEKPLVPSNLSATNWRFANLVGLSTAQRRLGHCSSVPEWVLNPPVSFNETHNAVLGIVAGFSLWV